jgi:hypothetical protein
MVVMSAVTISGQQTEHFQKLLPENCLHFRIGVSLGCLQ